MLTNPNLTNTAPIKTSATKEEHKLENLIHDSNKNLMRLKTTFPFTPFPDTLIIDTNKIDIIHATFFYSKKVFTILIKDLMNVQIHTGIIFASLEFEVRGFEQNPSSLSYLDKKQAIKAQQILTGLIVSYREGIDLTQIDPSTLKSQLIKVGQSQADLLDSGFN